MPIRISGIGADLHHSHLYSVVKVWLPAVQKEQAVLVELEFEVHLIKGLKYHMLVGNDMMTPYKMALSFHSEVLDIGDGFAQATIRTTNVDAPIQHRKVKTGSRTVVPPHSRYRVPINFKSFHHDRDVSFTPRYHQSSAFLAHPGVFLESVCGNSTNAVWYYNKSDRPVIIPKGIVIGEMSELEDLECHLLEASAAKQVLGCDPFTAAERHAKHQQIGLPSAVTGMHLSSEAFVGIGDRVPKATEELISDGMGDSLLDDIGMPEMSSSIEDIKIAPDLTDTQRKKLWALIIKHRSL